METLRGEPSQARYYAYEDRERHHVRVHHVNCRYVQDRLRRWDDEWRYRWYDLEFCESPDRAITDAHRVVGPAFEISEIQLCGHCERRFAKESRRVRSR